jgi:hypothetical protein
MLEMGVINIGGEFFLVGDSSEDEFELFNNQLIHYKAVEPINDEKTERMIILNSILKYMPPAERDLILQKKAVIIYRNNSYVIVYDKIALEAIQ